jgi:hypothetical protein
MKRVLILLLLFTPFTSTNASTLGRAVGKNVDIRCYSSGEKIYDGEGMIFDIIGSLIFIYESDDKRYVILKGDCVMKEIL